jgi:hypothetical protein
VLPDVTGVKKSGMVRWVGDVARMSDRRMLGGFGCETGRTVRGRRGCGWEDNGNVAEKKRNERAWTGCIWHRIRESGGLV